MQTREYAEPRRARAALASLPADNLPMFRIEPSKGWVSLKLHELWEYRELLYFLIWRDVKVRYKQTAWSLACSLVSWPRFLPMGFPTLFSAMLHWCRGCFLRMACSRLLPNSWAVPT